jgi:hypothetical protein
VSCSAPYYDPFSPDGRFEKVRIGKYDWIDPHRLSVEWQSGRRS